MSAARPCVRLLAVGLFGGGLGLTSFLSAAETVNLQIAFDHPTSTFTLTWNGHSGYTYFIQESPDLVSWSYVPVIKSGVDGILTWSVQSPASRGFWRLRYVDLPTVNPTSDDFDLDGASNIAELSANTDPTDYYNGAMPTLTKTGGDNQSADIGQFNAQPFEVAVFNAAGTAPLANAPVTFSVTQGGGLLAATSIGSPSLLTSVDMRTGVDGTVRVFYRQPAAVGVLSQIRASAGAAVVAFGTTSTLQDSDGNGLPDVWEVAHFGHSGVDPGADPDGDGRSNLQEYQLGSDPADYFNGVAPTIAITAGNNQTAAAGEFDPQPLTVSVLDASGTTPKVNAPIVFSVTQGSGGLASAPSVNSPVSGSLTSRTNSEGNAQVYFRQPAATGMVSHITASAGTAQVTFESTSLVPNIPPIVTLTAPTDGGSFVAPGDVLISAAASDTDGTIAKVEFYAGATKLGESVASPYQLTWNGVPAGSYSLKARAYDNTGAYTDSTIVHLTGETPHQPPTVTLTSPAEGATIAVTAPVVLTASATAYSSVITRVDLTANGVLLQRLTGPPFQYTWSLIPPGIYSITATAYDATGAATTSAAIETEVVARRRPLSITLTDPVAGARFRTTETVDLTADVPETGGTIAKVEFYRNGERLGEATAAPYQFAWENAPAGSYSITAKVFDDAGETAVSAPVTMQIVEPPSATLTAPVSGVDYPVPATVTLAATAYSSDHSITRVEFLQAGMVIGTALAPPYEFVWSDVAGGVHEIKARAYVDDGTFADSSPVSFSVSGVLPPTVALVGPEPGLTYAIGSNVTFLASAQQPGGFVGRIDFLADSELIGWVYPSPWDDPSIPTSITHSFAVAGTYAITARAYGMSGTVTDSVPQNITILSQPPPTSLLFAEKTSWNSIAIAAIPAATSATISGVELYGDGVKIASLTAPPYSYQWTNVGPGTHTIAARVYDSAGGVSLSAPSTVIVSPQLPFTDDFEAADGYALGSLSGQQGWTVTPGFATAVVTSYDPASGAQSAILPGSAALPLLTKNIESVPDTVVYVDFYAKPVADSNISWGSIFMTNSYESQITVQRVGRHGEVLVSDSRSSGWRNTGIKLPLNPDNQPLQWVRFTQRLDYVARTWDLYVDGKMVVADLGMDSNQVTNKLSSFSVQGQGNTATGLDRLNVSYGNPLFVDTANDGIDDQWKISHGLSPTVNGRIVDPANSGLTLVQKYARGLDPSKSSTIDDGISDGWKVAQGLDPLGPSLVNYDPAAEGLTVWQKYLLSNLSADGYVNGPFQDTDTDGIPDLVEIAGGTSPTDFYNGGAPALAISSGASSPSGDGRITVQVKGTDGQPLINAPVTFTVQEGNSRFSLTPDGEERLQTATVTTDSAGWASVYIQPEDL